MARFSEAEVIYGVNFEEGTIADVAPEEVGKLWEQYHEAVANGGVEFPLVEESFADLAEKMGVRL